MILLEFFENLLQIIELAHNFVQFGLHGLLFIFEYHLMRFLDRVAQVEHGFRLIHLLIITLNTLPLLVRPVQRKLQDGILHERLNVMEHVALAVLRVRVSDYLLSEGVLNLYFFQFNKHLLVWKQLRQELW